MNYSHGCVFGWLIIQSETLMLCFEVTRLIATIGQIRLFTAGSIMHMLLFGSALLLRLFFFVCVNVFLLIFGYVGWYKQTRLLSHSHTEESYLWSSHCFLDRKLLKEDLRLHVSSLVKLGRESDIVLAHSDATINLSGHWLNQVVSLLLDYNSNFTHFTLIHCQ